MPEPAVTSVTTGSAELTSTLPVPPELTSCSAPTTSCTAATTAPRRVASSAAERFLTNRTAGDASGSPAICAS